ncbi:MAG: hypothetical protein KatS3mg027_1638 [Bacteroidia bacterium]|nr:MAG: hypothetical protein KatS3mg027_1638 [Bacteroidia bacterium]
MKNLYITFILVILVKNHLLAQPANDNCANATQLTSGSQLCGQNSTNATLETNECYINFAGSSESTMWYYFNATSSTMVLNFLQTNVTNCYPAYIVSGPYTSLTNGCNTQLSPSIPCSSNGSTVLANATPPQYVSSAGGMYYNLLNLDPGNYITLNGLNTTAGNNTYLVQIINNNCGGGNSRWVDFCIGVNTPASNSTPSGASVINSCGTQFNGSTQGGYAPNDWSTSTMGNIDGNSSTSCPSTFGGSCNGSNGNDVPFVVNNPSYFTFCAAANGTYNINFDVGTCTQPISGAQGAQMAILIGSASSMTLNQVAPNPMLPSSAVWTSSNFSLATGQCAYLVVDGYAGDQCTYSYTLNNVGGGCLLPIELIRYTAQNENGFNRIGWVTATEKDNAYFTLEKSEDGIHFEVLQKVNGAGTSYVQRYYEVIDDKPFERTYYQLSQTDYDGTTKRLGIVVVDNKSFKPESVQLLPNPTNENTTLSVYSNNIIDAEIRIVDVSGKIIDSQNVQLTIGNNEFNLNTSVLEKGIYFVTVQSRYSTQVVKLIRN